MSFLPLKIWHFAPESSKTNMISISLFLSVFVMKCTSYALPGDCGVLTDLNWSEQDYHSCPQDLPWFVVFCRYKGIHLVNFSLDFCSCVPGKYSQCSVLLSRCLWSKKFCIIHEAAKTRMPFKWTQPAGTVDRNSLRSQSGTLKPPSRSQRQTESMKIWMINLVICQTLLGRYNCLDKSSMLLC